MTSVFHQTSKPKFVEHEWQPSDLERHTYYYCRFFPPHTYFRTKPAKEYLAKVVIINGLTTTARVNVFGMYNG